jgi:hypothetical protein
MATKATTTTQAPATQAPATQAPATQAPAPQAAAPAKAKKGARARWLSGAKYGQITEFQAMHIAPGTTYTILVQNNPKRKASAVRFAKYRAGQTAAQYCEIVGKRLGLLDLAWDHNHGFIKLSALPVVPAASAPAENAAPAPQTPAQAAA